MFVGMTADEKGEHEEKAGRLQEQWKRSNKNNKDRRTNVTGELPSLITQFSSNVSQNLLCFMQMNSEKKTIQSRASDGMLRYRKTDQRG